MSLDATRNLSVKVSAVDPLTFSIGLIAQINQCKKNLHPINADLRSRRISWQTDRMFILDSTQLHICKDSTYYMPWCGVLLRDAHF